jgi:acyl-CoA synthetase (AMP-forming)/AMP-acid ligase II
MRIFKTLRSHALSNSIKESQGIHEPARDTIKKSDYSHRFVSRLRRKPSPLRKSNSQKRCRHWHLNVQDCAVIGVPDEKWGEAVIEVVPQKTVNEQDIINLCKDKLESIKAPKTIEVWETLPRSPVGKVVKESDAPTILGR